MITRYVKCIICAHGHFLSNVFNLDLFFVNILDIFAMWRIKIIKLAQYLVLENVSTMIRIYFFVTYVNIAVRIELKMAQKMPVRYRYFGLRMMYFTDLGSISFCSSNSCSISICLIPSLISNSNI